MLKTDYSTIPWLYSLKQLHFIDILEQFQKKRGCSADVAADVFNFC